ncbi:CGNR zinc finger domain-containing protein [Conexibacter arvalis]|uniref:Putative RNA-binding Zn ribbon-like protein n=1 Tax=Conexibacter arvalis TaxID=912552 RepID=A0A840ICN4_9ACTN|nr:CGNR zinc finger domain-containing protein [Conexibacter arvalis]MBB4661973.1 putative RNA-binding Zn ribbon-like protein [Conexibacter arvalis]
MTRSLADSKPARAVIAMTAEQRAALPRRTAFVFTGRPAVDLAMTGGDDWLSVWEVLHAPADLDRWLAEGALAVPGTRADADDLRAARALRRAVTAAVDALLGERLPQRGAIEAIDAAAAVAPLVPHVDPRTGARGWARPTARAALSDVARDALELIADRAQWERLRICASDDCGIVFYDASRPGRRRWCSTERCGDRNRARSYRARRRSG